MSGYELTLPPERPDRNLQTGRFMKGHVPANKGLKWSEYLGRRAQKRCAKGWINLELYGRKGNPTAGRPKKPVVAIDEEGNFRVYSSVSATGRHYGISKENIARCCRLNSRGQHTGNTNHRYYGLRFYFEEDGTWTEKINR